MPSISKARKSFTAHYDFGDRYIYVVGGCDDNDEIMSIQRGVQAAVGGPIPKPPTLQKKRAQDVKGEYEEQDRKKRSPAVNSPEYEEQEAKAQELREDFERQMAILEGNNLMIVASNQRLVRETQELKTKNYELRQQINRMNGQLNEKDREIAMARESRDIELYRKIDILNKQVQWLKETLENQGLMPESHINTALQQIADINSGGMEYDSGDWNGGLSDVGPDDYKPNNGIIKW